MISICIPVYNKDVRPLVRTLTRQLEALATAGEVLVLDDFSTRTIRQQNREIAGWRFVRYEELPENAGRAKIRNRLAAMARYDFLLFLDCNIAVEKPDFLQHYLQLCKQGYQIVCGGQHYPQIRPARRYRLRHTYGRKVEARDAAYRCLRPNASFRSKNFAVSRKVFLNNPMDERLTGYGHEDTLFGWQLYQAGVTIHHTDNPVIHLAEETNAVFLQKVDESIRQLIALQAWNSLPENFFGEIRLIRFYKLLRRYGLQYPARWLFVPGKPLLRAYFLLGGNSLFALAFYKMGRYLQWKSNRQQQPAER